MDCAQILILVLIDWQKIIKETKERERQNQKIFVKGYNFEEQNFHKL